MILREVRAIVASGATGSLTTSISAFPLAASVAATDRFPLITSAGVGYRATATLIRDYVLGISGGNITLPEPVIVGGLIRSDTNNTDDLGSSTVAFRTGYFGTRLGIGIGTTLSTDVNLDVASGFGVRPSSSVSYPTVLNGGFAGKFYAIHAAGDWGFVIGRAVSDTLPANLTFYKTRSATGARTVVQNGDYIARMTMQGVSATGGTVTIGAAILAQVNGAVSDGVMPTDLLFAAVATGDATAANSKVMLQSAGHWTPYTGNTNSFDLGNTGLRWRTVYAGTSVVAPLVNGTTRVTSPLLGTTSDVDVVLDRNSVTQLTLGSLLATFAGAVNVTETLAVDTDLLFVDVPNQLVGIGTVLPETVLDVNGTFAARGSGPKSLGGGPDARYSLTEDSTFTPASGSSSALHRLGGTLNPLAGTPGYGFTMFGVTINKAGSGTHTNFSTLDLSPPTIGAGASTLDLATTLYISGSPSGATENHALMIGSGTSRFNGIIRGPTTTDRVDLNTSSDGVMRLRATTDMEIRIDAASAGTGRKIDFTHNSGTVLGTLTDDGTLNMLTSFNVAGTKVVGAQGAAVTDPTGGVVIDAESRTAIIAIIDRLQAHGLIA